MKPNERLQVITTALAEKDPDNMLDPEEVAAIASDTADKPERIVGVMLYVKYRLVHKMSQTKAFEKAFPERSIATVEDASERFSTTTPIGEKLHRSTLKVKAQRLEASKLYKKVFTLLQTSLYVAYATDRLLILDEAFQIAMDNSASLRDRDRYMKLFLDETRKPAEAMKMELHMQVNNNNVTVVDVENKMAKIAEKLDGMSAAKVIDMVHNDSRED